jgi:hypothetical protein
MATRLELEEYLYRRAIDIIESADTDDEKELLLFQEVWQPLALLYLEKDAEDPGSPGGDADRGSGSRDKATGKRKKQKKKKAKKNRK